MPRDLFGDVTHPSITIGNRKWYTVPVSLLSHSAIVAALVAIPILAPALMPEIDANAGLVLPITPVIPPPPPLPAKPVPPQPVENPNAAPTVAPDTIAPEKPVEPVWRESDQPGLIPGGSPSEIASIIEPPAPPPVPQAPVRVGGAIRNPTMIRKVDPVYPAIAQAARVQGIVIIEATIGADGHIINARILRSVPLLDQAALDAVRQWQYTPTTLNGVPVPVIMTVTVSFTLSK
jgi:protein TonB